MEYIYYFLTSVVSLLLIVGFIWFIISLFRVKGYERKINELYKGLEDKINKEKQRTTLQSIAERRMKVIKEDYDPKIKEIERKRQFILDKLPFIK